MFTLHDTFLLLAMLGCNVKFEAPVEVSESALKFPGLLLDGNYVRLYEGAMLPVFVPALVFLPLRRRAYVQPLELFLKPDPNYICEI